MLRWYGYPIRDRPSIYAPIWTVKNVDENISEGTWLDSTGSYQNHELPIPSNVTRISQAIKPLSTDGIEQVIYYQVSPTLFLRLPSTSGLAAAESTMEIDPTILPRQA